MDFDLQPRLHGKLLDLRPLTPQDFDALFAAAGDPLIWEQHPEKRYLPEVFREIFDGAIESQGALAVLERTRGTLIGTSRYSRLVPGQQVEIGWTFLARAFWGGEYNGELKQLMLDHAFRFVARVVFTVADDNLRSQKAVQKIGGVLIGTEDRPGTDGKTRSNVVFAITRDQWKAAHA